MSISRRKIIGLLPVLAVGFGSATKAEQGNDGSPNHLFGHRLPDDRSMYCVRDYVRCLAIEDERTRKEALLMFYEAEQFVVRGQGVRGYGCRCRLGAFLDAQESDDLNTPRSRHGG